MSSTRISAAENNLWKNAHSASSIFRIWPNYSIKGIARSKCLKSNTRQLSLHECRRRTLSSLLDRRDHWTQCVLAIPSRNWDEDTSDLIIITWHHDQSFGEFPWCPNCATNFLLLTNNLCWICWIYACFFSFFSLEKFKLLSRLPSLWWRDVRSV